MNFKIKRLFLIALTMALVAGCAVSQGTQEKANSVIEFIEQVFSFSKSDTTTATTTTTTTTATTTSTSGSTSTTATTTTQAPTTTTEPEPADLLPDEINPSEITFVGGPNIGEWERKYSLEVKFSGNNIQLIQEGTKVWPEVEYGDGKVCANPWVIAKIGGKWVAASFEWMRRNSQERTKRAVHGDHIKRPKEFGSDWQPKSGETLGFCVAGLSRGGETNASERTQIKTIIWE